MGIGQRLLWGGFGWAVFGPIGGIIGYTLASMSEQKSRQQAHTSFSTRQTGEYPRTKAGDFAVALLVLFGHVMKADRKLLRSELDYVRQFLVAHFGAANASDLMVLFRDILRQDYPLSSVCGQIRRSTDHATRLQLVHALFGLSTSDGSIHPKEVEEAKRIAGYLGISGADFASIRAMFVKDKAAAYRVLEIEPDATDEEVKRAYRRLANKHHPDKVASLGEEVRKMSEEKFKAINGAYQAIKEERNLA